MIEGINLYKNTKEYQIATYGNPTEGSVSFMVTGTVCEILDIEATKDRRKGVGTKLILAVIEYLNEHRPEVLTLVATTRSNNWIAQQFYESLNFRVVAPLRRYYGEESSRAVDAIMYGYDLWSSTPRAGEKKR